MKTFIVQRVACFDPASIVDDAVRMDTADSKTRKTFLEDTAIIAISDRAVRLRALQRKAENLARCSARHCLSMPQ
nr:DUF2280 domain-containing protein [Sinorhizobium meliloti]